MFVFQANEDEELRQHITEEARLMSQIYSNATFPLEVLGKAFLEESAVAGCPCKFIA